MTVPVRWLAACLCYVSIGTGGAWAQAWRSYGGDLAGTRYSVLSQINRGNVANVRVAWTYHTGDISDGTDDPIRTAFESTPIVIGGMMYFTTPFCRVIALDAETGKLLWCFDPHLDRTRPYPQYANRGVAYWQSGRDRRIYVGTLDGRLIGLNANDGKPAAGFGDNGTINLRRGTADAYPESVLYGMTSPPLVYKDLVVAGTVAADGEPQGPSGDVRAFDAKTGREVWRFHVVPHPGEPGAETWEGGSAKGRGGVNAWAPLSCDFERGILYLPLTSPSHDPVGTDRKGANLYGDALVALDAATGKKLSAFQTIHHDLWDWDLPAQPHGEVVKGRIVRYQGWYRLTRTGLVFVLNRLTGAPGSAWRSARFPPAPFLEEQASPSQPFQVNAGRPSPARA